MTNKATQNTVLQVWGMRTVTAYTPPKASPAKTTNDDLICGVELEIENLVHSRDRYADMAGEAWSVVEDGSLRPRGLAWEFVSRPMALNVLLPVTEKLFNAIGVQENTNYSDRCSVHVHANVQNFTQEQLASLALIYPVFEEVLFQYVNHYKKKEEQGYCRDTNLYCIPWSACRMNRKFVDNLFSNAAHTHHNWQKYTALNLLPISEKGTVEWRHMHGTCDMEKLTTWYNIIGAIMRFAKERSFDSIVDTIKVMNDVSTYKQLFDEVLSGTLVYDEQYRKLLRDGVVNAKYSLLNWEFNKDMPKNKKKLSSYYMPRPAQALDYMWEEELPQRDEPPAEGFVERVGALAAVAARELRFAGEMARAREQVLRNPAAEVTTAVPNTIRNPIRTR